MKTIDKVKQMIADGVLAPEDAAKYFPELTGSDDEKKLSELLYHFKQWYVIDEYQEEIKQWIQGLIKKQPACSEDDERITEIKTFIAQCNGFNSANRHAVFRMLDALNPQKQWKPTETQLECLKAAWNEHFNSEDFYPLYTLYEQLKALQQ